MGRKVGRQGGRQAGWKEGRKAGREREKSHCLNPTKAEREIDIQTGQRLWFNQYNSVWHLINLPLKHINKL